jgi:predicted alpha-1,2-mannosidase
MIHTGKKQSAKAAATPLNTTRPDLTDDLYRRVVKERGPTLLLSLLLSVGLAFAAIADSPAPTFFRSFEPGEASSIKTNEHSSGFAVEVASGPSKDVALTAMTDAGFTGTHSLHYAGVPTKGGAGEQEVALFDVSIPVAADTTLSYVIFPQSNPGDLRNPSTFVSIDLLFSDGSRLSRLGALDQHRVGLTASAQGASRTLYPDQWNLLSAELGRVAAGKTITRVLIAHADPANATSFQGYVDDIRIGPSTATIDAKAPPSDYVNTLRGSNANGRFSRGNNFPAVAVPHGFNFWTPTTNAGSDWIYQYQARNGADNRPRIEAFSLSHEPSPWMGDRQTFQVMPAEATQGVPVSDRTGRALSFGHDNEIARAHYYSVRFDNGMQTEIAPTDHAAMFRFTFRGDRSQLIFDNRNDNGGIALDPADRSISGWSDVKSRLSTGATRLFFYAVFDRPVSESGPLTGQGRDHVGAWFGFDTRDAQAKVVTMRIATSLISLEQAKRNLSQEIAASDSFDDVRERARKLWDAKLGIIDVAGASHEEKVTLYSNLYRLFLYPNSGFENTGTPARPAWQYASPFSAPTGANTPTRTGARVVDGKVFVNNGFWDTYRTAWPAYTLLTPTEAGQMIDGFVQQYRDGGWIARWSSPGYADLMVGTSSDVAFADAWLKGVHNFDVRSFYQSALKNSAVVSPVPGAGRKGLGRSIFLGYTDTSVDEGLSWSMDGYINDFGIGNLAAALAAKNDAGDPYHGHYADDAAYYRSRALNYVNLFDPQVSFFVGRNPDGSWRYDAAGFNPLRWGGDYTETNAWNMAFHAPDDGMGLAALYGGREQLAAKLDHFFAAPGNFDVGSYGETIHEMLEARDVRMGQYGHSNQPSHHIIYMYDVAGQPWKTQDKVRDAVSRLYVGSEIGQGYPGDEDNGEMSAWWLFSAAGFYPLRMGSPEYAIGAPHFEHMTIHLENGKRIEIDAPGVSDTNRYIQSVRLNGQPWNRTTLEHKDLVDGAILEFVMGPKPSSWGSEPNAAPSSLTPAGSRPQPLVDFTGKGQGTASIEPGSSAGDALFDNDSSTSARLSGSTPVITYRFNAEHTVTTYTLTSTDQPGDPRDWRLQGSADGKQWTTLDERKGEVFPWRLQTRAFAVAHAASYRVYRLQFVGRGGAAGVGLAEIELMGVP